MWINVLWVALGGALGSVCRYLVGLLAAALSAGTGTPSGPAVTGAAVAVAGAGFPVATLLVNIAGSFLIGLAMGFVEHGSTGHLLAVVGFCGGFTTFSAFSAESLGLLRAGQTGAALLYIFLSLVLCLGATFLGLLVKSR